MRNRRGLSTLVGAVFFIIAASSTIAYVSYSMDVIDDFSQSVIIKESIDEARNSESFTISDATISNNKFDLTVQNNGQLPIKLTKLWIENTTDTTWTPSKFELDQNISPSGSVTGIGQTLSLYAIDTQAYEISLVTDRGNTETYSFNSVPDQAISINLHAAPENVANGFSTTLFMTVTNDLPNDVTLLNVTPKTLAKSTGGAAADCDTVPTPTSYPSLKPGESAIFKWSCNISGSADQTIDFTAELENGFAGNTASVTVCIKDVLLALESGTSLESLGFTVPTASDDILIFHEETDLTPNGDYQLSSGAADSSGTTLVFDDVSDSIRFVTKNNTQPITIPAGNWNTSLLYNSAPLPDTSVVDNEILTDGMIFHFETSGSQTDSTGNGNTGTLCSTSCTPPSLQSDNGLFSSNTLYFDGDSAMSIASSTHNTVGTSGNGNPTTAILFQADVSTNGPQYLYNAENTSGQEYYRIFLDASGNINFEFDGGGNPTSCVSSGTDYRNGNWQHLVVVRDAASGCDVFVNGTSISPIETAGTSPTNIDIDNIFVGAESNNGANGFEGHIDLLMHWDDEVLTSSEITSLNNTKYGIGAHVIDFTISQIFINGTEKVKAYEQDYELDFHDDQGLTSFLSSFNVTSTLSQLDFDQEELVVIIEYESGLAFDLRIDDSTVSDPDTTFIQFPNPTNRFPGFFSYDTSSGNYDVRVSNTGTVGAWFTFGGIRGVFDDVDSDYAYASIPRYVNGTGDEFAFLITSPTTELQDSMLLRPGTEMTIEFYPPTTHPSVDGDYGVAIPAGGNYNFYVYLSGYDEQGRTFFKTIDIGGASVT